MGSFGSPMDTGTPGAFTFGTEQPGPPNPSTSKAHHKPPINPINHAANAPPGFGFGFHAKPVPGQPNAWSGVGQSSSQAASGSVAFTELDANQQPLFQRARFAAAQPAGGKRSDDLGDQGMQMPPAAAGTQAGKAGKAAAEGANGPANGAAAASGSWAGFLSGIQHQTYSSPGAAAAAANRRAGQRKGSTPRASRMQQQAAGPQTLTSFGSPLGPTDPGARPGAAASPMFAFGSPVPPMVPPGTAMSTGTELPATNLGAAFSAMSLDSATPIIGSGSSGQPWPYRGPRAAAVTGKRLFETPSSAGGTSASGTPSPFSQADSSAKAAGGTDGRAAAEPVPFPGFGSEVEHGPAGSSSPGGFGFSIGGGSKGTPNRSRLRRQQQQQQQRGSLSPSGVSSSSPASAPASSAPSFGGFGAPPAPLPADISPGVSGSFSFQGFPAGPGSTASTPGFSPMAWSPANSTGDIPSMGAAAAGQEPAGQPSSSSGAGGSAVPRPSASLEELQQRQQAAAAAEQQASERLQQAQQHVQQQTAARAEAASAAAADIASASSTGSLEDMLRDLSAGNMPAAPQVPESETVSGLRQAVEQLSTGDQNTAQTGHHHQQQQQDMQQEQLAAPSFFFFGSPDHKQGATESRYSSEAPSTGGSSLFEMSPLRSSASKGSAAPVSDPEQQQPATASTAGPVFTAAPSGLAADACSQPATATATAAGPSVAAASAGGLGGFTFTVGKADKAAASAATPGKLGARSRKQTTPGKAAKPEPAAAAAASVAAGFTASFQPEPAPAAAAAASVAAGFTASFQPETRKQQQVPAHAQPSAIPSAQPPSTEQPQDSRGVRHFRAARRSSPSPAAAGFNPPPQQQQQQQWASQAPWKWPPAPQHGPQQPPAAASQSFTLGAKTPAKSPLKSPRKATKAVPQQPQQQPAAPAAADDAAFHKERKGADAAIREAESWVERAQHSWNAQRFEQSEAEFTQGIYAVAAVAVQDEQAANMLCQLYNNRAAARIGLHKPVGALEDALASIRCRKKFIKGYLRASTCLVKLGCLAAANKVLDKVMDMISASSPHWRELTTKRQQVEQLVSKQQRVVAAALGCDAGAAAAALAALAAGQPVKVHLEGFIAVPAVSTPAATAELCEAGRSALDDAALASQLLADAASLLAELAFWEDGPALQAWLMLRAGKLDAAAAAAEAELNPWLQQLQRQQQGLKPGQRPSKQQQQQGRHWGWRWWVLAQVKWHQGDLAGSKELLQHGQEQLSKLEQQQDHVCSSIWRALLPSRQELSELQQQLQQLIALKEAGNASVNSKRFDAAVEEYSKALALEPSCGFAAVIHSNRAAAYQQQQKLVEALADCSRAVALDPRYARAYLRMAQVLEALHRPGQAVVVLQDALKGAANAVDPATAPGHQLTHGAAALQLSTAERRKFESMLTTVQSAARRLKTPHHYKVLGLSMTASEADIKKSYRSLVLKHHPDKALQQCMWSEQMGSTGAAAAHPTATAGGIQASLKAAANEVFGYISAAYEELRNSSTRSKVDRDLTAEEMFTSSKGDPFYDFTTYGGYGGSSRHSSQAYYNGGGSSKASSGSFFRGQHHGSGGAGGSGFYRAGSGASNASGSSRSYNWWD